MYFYYIGTVVNIVTLMVTHWY